MLIREYLSLATENRISESIEQVKEGLAGEYKLTEVRAIYPLITGLNSGRCTGNYTFYPRETLIGKKDGLESHGYPSFVLPYGKPILREHRMQDQSGFLSPPIQAEAPMGRIIWAGYRARRKTDPDATPAKEGYPGTKEGDGAMLFVAAVTNEDAIQGILGHAYHTVSIGARVEKVIESISGEDLVACEKEGKEWPPYIRGQMYDGKLSYWTLYGLKGKECSYVNNPSDELAKTKNPNIGEEGLRILMGERANSKEFKLYDAKTKDLVEILTMEESVTDNSFLFQDSLALGAAVWLAPESADPSDTEEEDEEAVQVTLESVLDEVLKDER